MRAIFLLVSIVVVGGCGGGNGGAADADADSDADTDSDTDADSDVDCPADADLVGVWGVRARLGVTITERPDAIVHLCPSPQQATATLFLRLDVTSQDGTNVVQTLNVCDVRFPTISGRATPCDQDGEDVPVEIALGDGLAALIPTIDIPGTGTLEPGGDGCLEYRPTRAVVTLGTTFDDDRAALPEWTDGCETTPAECVDGFAQLEDDDADAELGVTLTATSDLLDGEAYVAFRTAPEMTGHVIEADTLVGEVDPILEYSIVDSDIELSGLPLDTYLVIQSLPTIDPDAATSSFTALRSTVIGGDDCAAIVAAENAFDI